MDPSSKFKKGETLRFDHALIDGIWCQQVEINCNAAGFIESIDNGVEPWSNNYKTAIPGMCNVHSHAHQRAICGLTEVKSPAENNFWGWREAMYRTVLKLNPDDLEAIAAQLYLEMLKAGYTSVGEFQYLHHQINGRHYTQKGQMSVSCINAAQQTGIALSLLPVLYHAGGFGQQKPRPEQIRFINDAKEFITLFNELSPLIDAAPLNRIGIAPHSLRAVHQQILAEVIEELSSTRNTLPIHIHIAEQQKEVDDCLHWCNQRPVEYLAEHFKISPSWCLVHATHINQIESELICKSGAVVGLCPNTEANLGDGIFPAKKFLNHNGQIAIGSDSQATLSVAEEIRLLEYGQRLIHQSRNVLAKQTGVSTGVSLYQRCLSGCAQALDQPAGKLSVGYRADIVVLNNEHPILWPKFNSQALDSWIFSAGNSAICDVYVAAQKIIEQGQHSQQQTIFNRYKQTIKKILS